MEFLNSCQEAKKSKYNERSVIRFSNKTEDNAILSEEWKILKNEMNERMKKS